MEDKPHDLRRAAEQLRSMAMVPTEGAHDIDRWLMQLADRLDLAAIEIERQDQSAVS